MKIGVPNRVRTCVAAGNRRSPGPLDDRDRSNGTGLMAGRQFSLELGSVQLGRTWPQGLKLDEEGAAYGTTEAVPLTSQAGPRIEVSRAPIARALDWRRAGYS